MFVLNIPTWAWANNLTFASTWQCHQSFDLAAIISFCRQSHKRLSLNQKHSHSHSHSRNQHCHRRSPQTTNSFNYPTCRLHIGRDPFCLLSDKSPSKLWRNALEHLWGEYMKYLCGCVRISLRTNWLKCGSADSDRTGSFVCLIKVPFPASRPVGSFVKRPVGGIISLWILSIINHIKKVRLGKACHLFAFVLLACKGVFFSNKFNYWN